MRQRTVRSETTKDKAGALPPAVYHMAPQTAIPGQSLDFDGEVDDPSDDHCPNERDAEDEAQVHNGANTATNVYTAHGVSDITFVNDSEIRGVRTDEFESDSDDNDEYEVSQEVFHPVSVTRSGRRVRAFVCFCKICFKIVFLGS